MFDDPLFGETVERLGCELGPLDNIWCSSATESIKEYCGEARDGSVATHVNDVRLVGVAIHNDEEVVPCIWAVYLNI